jgi:hypothetical protein
MILLNGLATLIVCPELSMRVCTPLAMAIPGSRSQQSKEKKMLVRP